MSQGQRFVYAALKEATRRGGSQRAVYSPDGTLTRRGLLTRADKRARELQSAGVQAGQAVLLALGNVPELLVLLAALDKIGAVAVPVDPANGDGPLTQVMAAVRVHAVVRRPRGDEAPMLAEGYEVVSRRRLPSSLLNLERLEPPVTAPDMPEDSVIGLVTQAPGGAPRLLCLNASALRAMGEAASAALRLDPHGPLVTTQLLTLPAFFQSVLLPWLRSESALVMSEGPSVESALALCPQSETPPVLVEELDRVLAFDRYTRGAGIEPNVTVIVREPHVDAATARRVRRLGPDARALLLEEEFGVLATHPLRADGEWTWTHCTAPTPGDVAEVGGHAIQVAALPGARWLPDDHATERYALGWAAKFSRSGELTTVTGRYDSLVHVDGRRLCLDAVEREVLEHRRVRWCRAELVRDEDGAQRLHVDYTATGDTELDDLEEHNIGRLPPYMVPRSMTRHTAPPA